MFYTAYGSLENNIIKNNIIECLDNVQKTDGDVARIISETNAKKTLLAMTPKVDTSDNNKTQKPTYILKETKVIDISTLNTSNNRLFTEIPSIDYTKVGSAITYTFSFDITIEKNFNMWRNIMCHGTNSNRQPSIFLSAANKIQVSFVEFDVDSNLPLTLNVRNTVTVVVKNNTVYLYINGNKDKETVSIIDLKWDTSVTDIWNWNSHPYQNFGFIKITNAIWWNVPLSDTDVKNHYNKINRPTPAPTTSNRLTPAPATINRPTPAPITSNILTPSPAINKTSIDNSNYMDFPYAQYTDVDTDIKIVNDTLDNCKNECNKFDNCLGFSRALKDNDVSECQLKKKIDATMSSFKIQDDTLRTWLKPSNRVKSWEITFMKNTVINDSKIYDFPLMPNITGFQPYQIIFSIDIKDMIFNKNFRFDMDNSINISISIMNTNNKIFYTENFKISGPVFGNNKKEIITLNIPKNISIKISSNKAIESDKNIKIDISGTYVK